MFQSSSIQLEKWNSEQVAAWVKGMGFCFFIQTITAVVVVYVCSIPPVNAYIYCITKCFLHSPTHNHQLLFTSINNCILLVVGCFVLQDLMEWCVTTI